MSSKKKYLNQSFAMVRRAEDTLFNIVAGLSYPLLSKPGAVSQDFSLLFWDLHVISLGVHEPVLGAGQENAQSCHWEKLQSKGALESCRPFHCGACFWEQMQHKLFVSLLLYLVFIIFDSFTFFWAFFLTYDLLPIFFILNPTYLCLWKGMHWFVCLDRLSLSCASALN